MENRNSPLGTDAGLAPGKVVLWLQNGPDHYFVAMIDKLNAMEVGIRFHAVFLCQAPQDIKSHQLPKCSAYCFLGPDDQRGPVAKGPLATIHFDAAIIGGYNTRFKRRFITYCNKTHRPAIMFADSNIRSERGRNLRRRLKRRVKKLFLSRLCRRLDYIIPCNRFGSAYWRYYGARKEQICRSTYFCDTGEISVAAKSSGSELRDRYGIPQGARVIFTAARLVPVKALHLMIQAFVNCRLAEKGWIWVIAGTGPLREELARQARESAGDAIKFLGFVAPEDVKALARHSELFVLPSIYEPHGIVVSEAMSVGTPVIASDVCGAAGDLVTPGKTGWIFKNGSVESLAKILATATSDPDRLRAMRPGCEATFTEWYAKYGPENVIPELLRSVLERRYSSRGDAEFAEDKV